MFINCRIVNPKNVENYRKVLTDCARAIKLNPKNVKAYYRSAKALYELDKIDEAIDCCDHGIEVRVYILFYSFHL